MMVRLAREVTEFHAGNIDTKTQFRVHADMSRLVRFGDSTE